MEKSKLYQGEVCGYCDVKELKDEKLLNACEKAVEVILSHNWRDMSYGKSSYPRADFEVEGTDFEACKVFVINDEGTIFAQLAGKLSKKRSYNDFIIDLSSHPQIREQLRKYSYEAYLEDKYSEDE